MANVSIRDVRKRFGTTEVLHGVSVEIDDGEFVILVGPSGCGKSTLLRMIAGLENISAGEIAIGGRVVNNVAPKERDIAMVFQNYALYPHMTVRDNMAFALSLAKLPKAMIEQQVARAAQILGLAPYLNRYPRQLSGGQRQRVAMGRAIVRDPQVFLFDEPLSNLDAKLRVQMRAEIKELHQRLTTTTVYVTHDQIEAMTMADKIVVMNSGNVEQIGAPLELYDRPNNLFVAGFIGSPAMNFLQGRIEGGSFRAAGGAALPLPGKANGAAGASNSGGANGSGANGAGKASASGGKPMVYGVRPEHFQLSAEGLPATVHVIEPTGSETQVMADFAGTSIICAFRERVSAKPGETIRIIADPALVHLFDADSGQRVVG
jgi:multiple sugar transport system ATP-binding protein